jgi:hypothetical protein
LLSVLASDGTTHAIRANTEVDFTLASGDPDDLAIAVGEREGAPPALYTVAARRVFRPVPLPGARSVSALARLDETRWLIAGRTDTGSGFATVYSALDFECSPLAVPPTDAFTSSAGHVDRGIGLVAGRRGATLRVDGTGGVWDAVESEPDLACAAIDVQGRAWVGATGRLWSQTARSPWSSAWQNEGWTTPFVSLRADVGVIMAITVDGGVIEGRAA